VNGSTARVSVSVEVPPEVAFDIFTRDIDRWWRHGIKFRHAGRRSGLVCMELHAGGRLFESIDGEQQVVEVGKIKIWEPPQRLVFSWRNANYAPDEATEVEVTFTSTPRGTMVSVTHRGLTALRPDHPAHHGLENGPFIRMIGLWWSDQMTALREFANGR
jgi:uncharacterized protein YndB with AHSA1/START domain